MDTNKMIEKAEKLNKSVNTFILSCVGEDGFPMTKAVAPGRYRESIILKTQHQLLRASY